MFLFVQTGFMEGWYKGCLCLYRQVLWRGGIKVFLFGQKGFREVVSRGVCVCADRF